MRIFAISDLHLSTRQPKPMSIFGEAWQNHPASLCDAWRKMIGEDDLVLIAGDISWAMRLEEAMADLEIIASLPGEKALVRGNHDYWWSGITQVRRCAPPRLHFIHNDALAWRGAGIGGTRLWDFPGISWPGPIMPPSPLATAKAKPARGEADPAAIRRRELGRLRLSLSHLPADSSPRIALLHYPPVAADGRCLEEVAALFAEFKIDLCAFGHVHGLAAPLPRGANFQAGGTCYHLTSCDCLAFQPKLIWDGEARRTD